MKTQYTLEGEDLTYMHRTREGGERNTYVWIVVFCFVLWRLVLSIM